MKLSCQRILLRVVPLSLLLLPIFAVAQSLAGVSVAPTSVLGGQGATGTVTLTAAAPAGGTVVKIASSNLAATVPTTITVAAGATTGTFPVTTIPVSPNTNVNLLATLGSVRMSTVLQILAPTPVSVTVSPSSVVAATGATGTVTLNGPAPASALNVALSSSQACATVKSTVQVRAGATSATFPITTSQVTTSTVAGITASFNSGSATGNLTVVPLVPKGMSFSPTTVAPGATTTGTVTLNGIAPTGGFTVTLASNASFVVPPATLKIPAGQSSGTFQVTPTRPPAQSSVLVTATNNGNVASARMTVTISSDLYASSWPKFRAGATNQGVGTGGGAIGATSFAFYGPGIKPASSAATVGSDGTVYWGNVVINTETFYAMKPDGTFKWISTNFFDEQPFMQPVVSPDGHAWFLLFGGGIVGFNPDGTAGTAPNPNFPGQPVADSNNTVYLVDSSTDLEAWDITGTKIWDVTSSANFVTTPAILPSGLIVVGTGDGKLLAYNTAGSLVWQTTLGFGDQPGDAITCTSLGNPIIGSNGHIHIVYTGKDQTDQHTLVELYELDGTGATVNSQIIANEAPGQTGSATDPAVSPDGTQCLYLQDDAQSFNGLMYFPAAGGSGRISYSFVTGYAPSIGPDDTMYASNGVSLDMTAFTPAGAVKWTANQLGAGQILTGPDGTVYTTYPHAGVYAFQPDGTQKFAYGPYASSVAVAAPGVDWVGTSDGHVLAIGTKSLPISVFTGTGSFSGSPAIDAAGNVYATSTNGMLYCIRGTFSLNRVSPQKWAFQAAGAITASPAIGYDGTLYVGDAASNFYGVNPDGTQQWVFHARGPISSSAAVDTSGNIYVGTTNGYLYAFNSMHGSKYAVYLGSGITASPALGSDGTIYVGLANGHFVAISSTGAVKWTMTTGGAISSSAAIAPDGTIYVGSDDGNLYAFTAAGAQKWAYLTQGFVRSSPAIGSDGTIYVGSYDHNVYAITPAGATQWVFATRGPVTASPSISGDGLIHVGSTDGTFYVIK